MAKTISVDEFTYSNVVTLAGKMMMMFGKTFSLGFTIYVATQALDRALNQMPQELIKEAKNALKNYSSPEQMDNLLEETFEAITKKKG